VVSITVVDGVPLPPGEDFTGVIRVQDIRATEKDKVRMGDCFRGGDVVKGLVVRTNTHGILCVAYQVVADLAWRCTQLLHNYCTQ